MNPDVKVNTLAGIVSGVVLYFVGCINSLMLILAIIMVVDYILGTVVALLKNKWTRDIGIRGFLKKIGYVICIGLAVSVDFVVYWSAENTGFKFNTGGALGIAVSLYLFGVEGLSVLKHLNYLGVPIAPFFGAMLKKIRDVWKLASESGGK